MAGFKLFSRYRDHSVPSSFLGISGVITFLHERQFSSVLGCSSSPRENSTSLSPPLWLFTPLSLPSFLPVAFYQKQTFRLELPRQQHHRHVPCGARALRVRLLLSSGGAAHALLAQNGGRTTNLPKTWRRKKRALVGGEKSEKAAG